MLGDILYFLLNNRIKCSTLGYPTLLLISAKQAGAQGVLIYTLRQAHKLAVILEDNERVEELEYEIDRVVQGAINHLWDDKQGFFISGDDKQVSWISQIWCVLA